MPFSIQGLQQWWGGRPSGLRLAAEAAAVAIAGAAASALPRIPQPASYHSFAGDHRSFLGVPHVANVLSNAAMAVPGAAGLWLLLAQRRRLVRRLSSAKALCWASTFMCMLGGELGGVGLRTGRQWRRHVQPPEIPSSQSSRSPSSWPPLPPPLHPRPAAAGSAWYHLEPNNATLAWDRLGMVRQGLCMLGRRWVAVSAMLWPAPCCRRRPA